MKIENTVIARMFVFARLQKGFNQRLMATNLGIDQSTLSRIEAGEILPGHITYQELEQITGMKLPYLIVASQQKPGSDPVQLVYPEPKPDLEKLIHMKVQLQNNLIDLDQELARFELRLLTARDENLIREVERQLLESGHDMESLTESYKNSNPDTQGLIFCEELAKKDKLTLLKLRASRKTAGPNELFKLELKLEELEAKKQWMLGKVNDLTLQIEEIMAPNQESILLEQKEEVEKAAPLVRVFSINAGNSQPNTKILGQPETIGAEEQLPTNKESLKDTG